MWLPWDLTALMAAALAVGVLSSSSVTRRGAVGLRTFCRELSIVLFLYSVWQFAHELTVTHVTGALDHGRWVLDVEAWLHLPSEAALQRWFLPHPLWVQAMNAYYGIMHVPTLGAFLIWLFYRHRDRYPRWRNVLALTTGFCLAIQYIPVAPPRMLPGFVDTGLLYQQSVYGTGGSGIANQLSAMPSVHVAWAAVVGIAVIVVGRSKWRWLVLLHPVLTVLAITVTANHYWLDGIVAVALLGVAWLVVVGSERLFDRRRTGILARATKLEGPCLPSASPIPLSSPVSADRT
jgi:hypothetical protein